MNNPFTYYSKKLTRAGLAEAGTPLLGTGEGLLSWNREGPLTGLLTKVGERLGRRAILYCQPAEPYRAMLLHLAETAAGNVIHPQDFETRIFLK
ncbi:MAG: hypothetical protein WCJ37_16540, partial [Syntrophus sp. (in: bacteria)]